MTVEELEKKAVEYAINNSCKKCNRIMCDFPSEYCKWYTSVFEVVKEYLEQIEKMKRCGNCKHYDTCKDIKCLHNNHSKWELAE